MTSEKEVRMVGGLVEGKGKGRDYQMMIEEG